MLWLAAIATGAFVAAFALLSLSYTGVLNLDRFIPAVQQNLAANLFPGDEVTIGTLGIRREGWSLAVSFNDLSVRNAQGRPILTVPRGGFGVDTVSLMTGNISVRQVEFDGLDVKVAMGTDGAWRIAEASHNSAPDAQVAPGDKGAFGGAGDMLGALDRIVLRDAQVTMVNERLNQTLAINHVSADFGRRGDVMTMKLAGKSPSGPFTVDAQADLGGAPTFSFNAKDIGVKDWEDLMAPDPPATYDAPLSVSGSGAFDAAGGIAALNVKLGIGAGTLAFHGGDDISVVIDEAGAEIAWDDQQKFYVVKNLHGTMGETFAVLTGMVRPPEAGSQTWNADLATQQAQVGPGRPGETAMPLKTTMQIHVTPATGQIVLDNVAVVTSTIKGSLSLESHPDGDLRTMKFAMNVDKGSAPDVIRLWPRTIVTDARDWCRDHILAGDAMGSLALDLDGANFYAVTHGKSAEAERVHGQIHFTNAGLLLFDPGQNGPPLNFPDAAMQFNGRVFKATADAGDFALGSNRKLRVQNLTFFVPDTAPAVRIPSRATAEVLGGADALAELVQHEPMKSYLGATLDPALVKGDFDGTLAVDIPLGKNVTPAEIKTTGSGTISNFALDQALGPHKFENANMTMSLDPGNFKVAGTGQFLGVSATMEATKTGKDPGAVALGLTLDSAVRKHYGIGDIPGLDGAVGVKVKAPWTKASADVEVDLAKATIEAPLFGTLKAAGKPGKASFTIKTNDQGLALQNLAVEAGALNLKGSGQIGTSGTLQSLKLSPLRLFSSDDIHAELVNDNSVWRVTAHGGMIDARPILQSLQKQSTSAKGASDMDLALDADFSSAMGPKSAALTQLQVSVSRIGGLTRHISLQGKLGLGTATYALDPTGQARLHLGDAGAGMKYLDLYSRMEGGVLDAEWTDQGGGQTGDLQMSAFTLRGEPALAQLAAAGQTDRTGKQTSAPFDPNTVDFQKLKARFSRANGRIDVSDAVVYNPLIGMTTEGFIDFRGNAIDLSGAFIPAYGLNSLAGHIPLLGVLLSGGANEGVFSVNYRLSGALDKSTLTVNPLSAATPGILRKVMGVLDGTVRPSPAAAATQ